MTFPRNPMERLPRGDKNRRLSLDVDREDMARLAGVTSEQLHDYEFAQPDGRFSIEIAEWVGAALERLEAIRTPRFDNGPVPTDAHR